MSTAHPGGMHSGNMMWRTSAILAALAVTGLAAEAPADRAEEIVRIHTEAIGGSARIAALRSFRATGIVVAGGAPVRFTLTAARPDRLRMELHYDNHTVVTATDGITPPWELDSRRAPARSTPLAAAAAQAFLADAGFDNPLVAGEAQGFRRAFAGEATIEGKKLLRLRVTKPSAEPFFLLLDPDSYFIVLRIDPPADAAVRSGSVVTRYGEFRPVATVLVPHEITVLADGRMVHQAKIKTIEPNPVLPPGHFSREDL